jgi:hypothetical protein
MRIEGRWLAGADGVERPVFDGFIAAPDGVQLLTPPDNFTLIP